MLEDEAQDQDWKPIDIKYALHKKGLSLRKLSRDNGYQNPNSVCKAFQKPWPKAEGIIAKALGVKPEIIWPSRYDGRRPKRGIGGKPCHKATPEYPKQPPLAT